MSADLKERVEQFRTLALPGQPQMMHMGTSYLLQDLWDEIQRLQAQCARLRTALEMGVQLCESGGHGAGDNCPSCHFMRIAQTALVSK